MKKPLKVYEVVPFWPAETFIQRHLASFSEMSFQPQICTKRIDYEVRSSSIQFTVQKVVELPRFYDLNVFKKISKVFYLWNYPSLWIDKKNWLNKIIYKFLKEKQPDLIHFHWTNLAIQLAPIAHELKIPFTFSMRGHDIKELTFDPKYVDALSEIIKLSSGVHSVSENIWQEAISLCDVDETSVRHKTIYTTVPIYPLREIQNNNKDTYTFVATGRFHWMKNFIGLLIAFRRLLNEGISAKLIVVGDGDEKERASLTFWTKYLGIEKFVIFTGTLSYSEITVLFEQSDGYIQSSISEGFSNSLAEAMSMGLPVFATNVGGTQEIIVDGVNGYLLDAGHAEDWWKKLILIQDREKMCTIRTRAWDSAKEKFNPGTHAEQFRDFYCESIGLRT